MIIEPQYRLAGYTTVIRPYVGGTGSMGTVSMTDDDKKKAAKRKRPVGFIWPEER